MAFQSDRRSPTSFDVYVTIGGKVIVADAVMRRGGSRITDVNVFDSLGEFLDSAPDAPVAAAVAEALGEPWVEDIE